MEILLIVNVYYIYVNLKRYKEFYEMSETTNFITEEELYRETWLIQFLWMNMVSWTDIPNRAYH